MILRDYQEADIERLRIAFQSGARGVLFVAPTASGKTVTFSTIVSRSFVKRARVWAVVHRQELLTQCSEALTELDVPHGIVAAGRYRPKDQVLVCSVQTLVRRVNKAQIGPVDLIILDEAHHASAGTWRAIIDARPTAKLLGVTATPLRLDGKGLGTVAGGVFDKMVLGPSVSNLISRGFLSPYTLYRPPPIADLTGVKRSMGDYAKGQLAAAMDKPRITGDAVEHYERLCPGRPALVFCVSIDHAKHVAEQFRERGWRSESVDGKLPDSLRRQRIQDLGNGRLHILTSCEIVSEGTDIPVVVAAILLRPTQSLGLYLQQVGRALRVAPGKEKALILDHVGNSDRHGWPDDERVWTLDGANNGQPQEGVVPMRTCAKCFAAFRPAPACPLCGTEYVPQIREIEHADGQLEEVTEVERQEMAVQRDRKTRIKRARTPEELRAVAKEFGYDPGWVDHILRIRHQYNERFRRRA